MIIINRKRLMVVLTVICVAVLCFSFNMKSYDDTVQTVALPVTNKVIVIDARAWCAR